ncbi:RNA polymerase sigma factor [Streptomyces sp. NPDC094038]|uniref:RNA polymerase sigma factor n=1 Tax=Streptomyces sp. NPDC094038 TaxID=3366055 RepID=UPI003819C9E8
MDTGLRRRVRTGDHDAFAALFEAYAPSVHDHAYRLTGDRTTAEEAVSLTFLEAWRLRTALDADGGSPRPWLFGIATNVVRNQRRAARRHGAVPSGDAAQPHASKAAVALLDDIALAAPAAGCGSS